MQSTQAQMRKRERKRLKREEKRRNLQAAGAHRSVASRDMSETFLDFIQPVIRFPPHYSADMLRRPLEIAAEVWNAVAAAEGDSYLAAAFVMRRVAEAEGKPVSPKTGAAIHGLALRKRLRFGDDNRIVTGVEVQGGGADVRVVISAIPPPW